jgi:isopenicillin N synthase-like dioxygenase
MSLIPTVDLNLSDERELIPTVDLNLWSRGSADEREQVQKAAFAAAQLGFFFITGVPRLIERQAALLEATKAFFALSHDQKASVRVEDGGVRWRGWMGMGGESTHGASDLKESLYLGNEHNEQHPGVVAGLPLHGRNRWPRSTNRIGAPCSTTSTKARTLASASCRC